MDRDDIIRMAREAGMERVIDIHKDGTRTIELPHPDLLERFAALVAAAEREAILQILRDGWFMTQKEVETAIQKRGQE